MEFTHLHWHSTFSFLEAIGTPKKIIEKAKELELKNIALTDLNGMYWSITFYDNAKSNWINPIIWTELWFVLDINWYNKIDNIGNICLVAKDSYGYASLMKIVSHANQEWINGKPKLDIEILEEYNKWLIAFMGWEISWIWKMIFRAEADDKIIEIINMIQAKLWKENVFLEIIAQNENENENIKKINKKILELSETLWIKCIVNNVFHYINKSDKEAWEMALAIKDGNKMYDAHRRKPKWEFHLMSWDEISEILEENWYNEKQINEWINNNNTIANNINIDISMWQSLFPNYNTAPHMQELYEKLKDWLISE